MREIQEAFLRRCIHAVDRYPGLRVMKHREKALAQFVGLGEEDRFGGKGVGGEEATEVADCGFKEACMCILYDVSSRPSHDEGRGSESMLMGIWAKEKVKTYICHVPVGLFDVDESAVELVMEAHEPESV